MDTQKPGAAPTALLQMLTEGQEITVAQVKKDLSLDRRQAYNAISRLENRGYLEWVSTGTYRPTENGVKAAKSGETITSGPMGPTGTIPNPKNTFRQRAWQAMRIRRSFTIGDVVSDAGTGDEHKDTENATRYIRQLRHAGIVGELPKRQKGTAVGSNGFKRFILVKNLGPKAPAYRAKKNVVHDFNSGEDLKCARA